MNISTKQRVPVRAQADPFEQFFQQFDPTNAAARQQRPGRRRQQRQTTAAANARSGFARFRLRHFARWIYRHQQPSDPGSDRHWNRRHCYGHHQRPQGISARIVGRDETSDSPSSRSTSRTWPLFNGVTAPGRGSATGSSRSVIPMASEAPLLRASSRRFIAELQATAPMTATFRPTRRSIWATAAARCSTSTAMSSASTRR